MTGQQAVVPVLRSSHDLISGPRQYWIGRPEKNHFLWCPKAISLVTGCTVEVFSCVAIVL